MLFDVGLSIRENEMMRAWILGSWHNWYALFLDYWWVFRV